MITIVNESNQHSWIAQGDYFFNQEQYTEALHAYGEGLGADPMNVELLSKTGNAYFSLHLYTTEGSFYYQALSNSDTYYLLYQYFIMSPQKNDIIVLQENLAQHQVIITVEGLEYIIDTIRHDQEHPFSQPSSQPDALRWEYLITDLITKTGFPFPSELIELAHSLKNTNQQQPHDISPLSLKRVTGPQFESFLAQFFQHKGYNVKRLKQSHDMGGDLLVKKNEETIIIQAKHRRHKSIGVKAIQEVYTAWGYYQTTRAMIITTSRFTQSALKLANKLGVKCCTIHELITALHK